MQHKKLIICREVRQEKNNITEMRLVAIARRNTKLTVDTHCEVDPSKSLPEVDKARNQILKTFLKRFD